MDFSTDSASNEEKSISQDDAGESRASSTLKEFNEKIEKLPTFEEKIACGLQVMRESISQEGSPRFRDFWEVRKSMLAFFKENLNPAIRSKLWDEYVELTVEARRLKEIMEEESAFAIEQIELAITSIETEVAQFDELAASANILNVGKSIAIGKKEEFYSKIQRELSLLNTWAARLNALRKEVMKTDMRIRFKTKLFKRISHLGDQIFPKRKELIAAISNEFDLDVDRFVKEHFQGEQIIGAPYYKLREEVKELQGMAKVFTLSSPVFHRTRQILSECWDKIRNVEKEQKKDFLEKKRVATEERAERQKEENEKKKAAAEEEKARMQARKESFNKVQEALQSLREGNSLDESAFHEKIAETKKEIEKLIIASWEKEKLLIDIRAIESVFAERKETFLLESSEGNSSKNLQLVLQLKKERRQEMKEILDGYRKRLGGSNLDFQQAIHLREWIDLEKERFEKLSQDIDEIEEKILEREGT